MSINQKCCITEILVAEKRIQLSIGNYKRTGHFFLERFIDGLINDASDSDQPSNPGTLSLLPEDIIAVT